MECDLHIHSSYSFDGTMTPTEIVKVAIAQGLGGIAVVDHDTIAGSLEVCAIAPKELIAIPGIEITTAVGDVVGLFVREEIAATDPLEAIDAIHAAGGLAILPHPLRTAPLPPEIMRSFDGIEGFNSRATLTGSLVASRGEPEAMAMADAYDLSVVGGSDAHIAAEIGLGRTVVPASTAEEIRFAIEHGHSICAGRRGGIITRLRSEVTRGRRMRTVAAKEENGESSGD